MLRFNANGMTAMIFAVCSISMTLFACNASTNKNSPHNTNGNDSETVQSSDHIQVPDEAIIVVRDIAGYFDDCGCTGEVRGGLARARSAALNAKRVDWLFLGRLIVPRRADLSSAQLEVYKTNIARLVEAATTLLVSLGNVRWLPDPDELDFLKQHDIDISELNQLRLDSDKLPQFAGMTFEVSDTFNIPSLELSVDLPYVNSRAREVLIFALWKPRSEQPAIYRGDIGALVRESYRSAKTRTFIDREVRNSEAPLLTSWTAQLKLSDPADPSTKKVVDEYDLTLLHSWMDDSLLPVESVHDSVLDSYSQCRKCHENAVTTWANSRHSIAYDTLLERNRHRDARCVSCHTNSIGHDGGIDPSVNHLAVTCNSCHELDSPATACQTCHTGATDPGKNALKALKQVCNGHSDNSTGQCQR